ncbi:hypothetical protein RCM99_24350 [Escherichia coli]|uniref:hypothetical protein n=1 Tax=Escherichia TaxID=561 RepID=UPI000BB91BDC|nr:MULTISPECIES: hypothetical protein [Escherichia]MED9479683.1 hypothetical protein [Escherichia marmotae]EIZ3555273.1 hypothetical protein [Escherichia coli]MBB8073076.1 hypothetical protein [Escherichia coli]MED9369947.1 hypothetical protein [Escherichia coli]HBA9546092.1 hypothetical protein [Escherichia coli]
MTTITRENAEIKSFITGFLSDPAHDNQSSNSLLTNVFRIALASLEAEPVVYMWDSERKDIDAPGYYRTEHLVFAESSVKQWGGRVVPLYTAPPATVVPEFETWFNSQESGRSICSTQIRRSLQEISWNACCAAMLQGKDDGILTNEDTKGDVQVRELTMLIKQLVSQLRKAKPDCKLPEKAMVYLKRNGLISAEDILR